MSQPRGFSLVETLVAMSLLSVGMLGTVGLQVATINGNRFGGRATQAMGLAEEKAAALEALDFNDPLLADVNCNNNPVAGADFPTPDKMSADPSTVADTLEALPLDNAGQPIAGGSL